MPTPTYPRIAWDGFVTDYSERFFAEGPAEGDTWGFVADWAAIGADDQVYVSGTVEDTGHTQIRLLTAGVLTPWVEFNPGGPSPWNVGLEVDTDGNVYWLASDGGLVKISAGGTVSVGWAEVTACDIARHMVIDSDDNLFILYGTTGDDTQIAKVVTSGPTVDDDWASWLQAGGYGALGIASDDSIFAGGNAPDYEVDKITSGGSVTSAWGTLSGSPINFAVTAAGDLWAAISGTSGIQLIEAAGGTAVTYGNEASTQWVACEVDDGYLTNSQGRIDKAELDGTMHLDWLLRDVRKGRFDSTGVMWGIGERYERVESMHYTLTKVLPHA